MLSQQLKAYPSTYSRPRLRRKIKLIFTGRRRFRLQNVNKGKTARYKSVKEFNARRDRG